MRYDSAVVTPVLLQNRVWISVSIIPHAVFCCDSGPTTSNLLVEKGPAKDIWIVSRISFRVLWWRGIVVVVQVLVPSVDFPCAVIDVKVLIRSHSIAEVDALIIRYPVF